jgi:hypothetical protein
MKFKLAVAVILVLLGVLFVRWELRYPSEWDKIKIGMTRQEVYSVIGPGVGEFSGWKGPFWQSNRGLVWYELEVSFEGNRALAVRQSRYFGQHTPF